METIYLGGGTPSLLEGSELAKILDRVISLFNIVDNPEITLEANPEDLTTEKSQELRSLGINRLSIGIQTFDTNKLKWMNRAHDARQSFEAYDNVRKAGFDNVSLDLIYALPDSAPELFQKDMEMMVQLRPEHISVYGLTIEEKTVFGKQLEKGILAEMPEDSAAQQYLTTISFLAKNGYDQYEVSNFSREGFHSKHNTGYWEHKSYLGVGPGAHSYNQKSRRFNIRNNNKYVKATQFGERFFEEEILSKTQQTNERILTGLRTSNGINLLDLEHFSGKDLSRLKKELINQLAAKKLIAVENNRLKLSPEGFLVADEIALQLFFDESQI